MFSEAVGRQRSGFRRDYRGACKCDNLGTDHNISGGFVQLARVYKQPVEYSLV